MTQALANVNDFMSFKVFNLKDIQEANAATGTFRRRRLAARRFDYKARANCRRLPCERRGVFGDE